MGEEWITPLSYFISIIIRGGFTVQEKKSTHFHSQLLFGLSAEVDCLETLVAVPIWRTSWSLTHCGGRMC
jgi:hypothetical protein